MQKIMFSIDDMHCGGCVARVTTALKAVPGVTVEKVEIGGAEMNFDPAKASPSSITQALAAAGYKAHARTSLALGSSCCGTTSPAASSGCCGAGSTKQKEIAIGQGKTEE